MSTCITMSSTVSDRAGATLTSGQTYRLRSREALPFIAAAQATPAKNKVIATTPKR